MSALIGHYKLTSVGPAVALSNLTGSVHLSRILKLQFQNTSSRSSLPTRKQSSLLARGDHIKKHLMNRCFLIWSPR